MTQINGTLLLGVLGVGTSVLALFDENDEDNAFAVMLDMMHKYKLRYDYYEIVHMDKSSPPICKVLQKWNKEYNTTNDDVFWIKVI